MRFLRWLWLRLICCHCFSFILYFVSFLLHPDLDNVCQSVQPEVHASDNGLLQCRQFALARAVIEPQDGQIVSDV